MDKIVIGIKHEFASDIEEFLEQHTYDKYSRNSGIYFSFEAKNWQHPNDPGPSSLMNHLFLDVGYDNYGFVRLGEEVGDIEVHGEIENFDIDIQRAVIFAESRA